MEDLMFQQIPTQPNPIKKPLPRLTNTQAHTSLKTSTNLMNRVNKSIEK